MFTKILIANRGEIAAASLLPLARWASPPSLSILTPTRKPATSSWPTRPCALAQRLARVPPAGRQDHRGCKQTGAQAVHPGYGFLSENEAFAKRCEDEGIAFIGPKAHLIAAMGDKIASKKLANEAKVNTIPGYNDAIAGAEQAVEIAKGISYPVMIKASAMAAARACAWPSTTRKRSKALPPCQNEARNSFGDDRIFIEKFVAGAAPHRNPGGGRQPRQWEWNGMEWNGMDGMEWNGTGMEWSLIEKPRGMEWNGIECRINGTGMEGEIPILRLDDSKPIVRH